MAFRATEKHLLVAALLAAGTLLAGWVAGVEIYRWALLRTADSVASATITAETLSPCIGKGCAGNDGPYRIKYRFSTASDTGTTYFYTGQELFTERWARVPERVWEGAARTKQIDVLYAPQDPRVNQPAALPTPSPFNAFGLAAIALLMAVVSGAYWRGHKV